MSRITALVIALGATEAAAHPGHLADVAGHTHWELLGGIALIALAGLPVLRALLRRR